MCKQFFGEPRYQIKARASVSSSGYTDLCMMATSLNCRGSNACGVDKRCCYSAATASPVFLHWVYRRVVKRKARKTREGTGKILPFTQFSHVCGIFSEADIETIVRGVMLLVWCDMIINRSFSLSIFAKKIARQVYTEHWQKNTIK